MQLRQETSLAVLSALVAANLKQLGQQVAVAESSTGGLISASLLAVPGASVYYAGGSVIYTLAARRRFLALDRPRLQGLEPLTEPMVMVFADAAREALDAQWGIAELGAAGPAGTPYGHSPGISVIGVSGPVNLSVRVETGTSDREANMWHFTRAALTLLEQATAKALESRAMTSFQSTGRDS
ncbi:MAG: nicotinamide-nucleotide amidase [Candidatus Azotimanducaceae bacterium]|jgi:nicotinamide-nucleotide amidase